MKLFCIDAGHGLHTAGKRCMKAIDPKETREWSLNSRIASKLQELLKDYDCQTMRMDDPTGQTDVPLATRVAKANQAKADAYLSIHHNAGIDGGAGGGIVVFVGNKADQTAQKLQKAIYDDTVALTGLRGNRSDALPRKDLYVLRNTKMPAILGEFGFMDSTVDTPMILTEKFADQVAEGLRDALVSSFGLEEETMTDEQFDKMMEAWLKRQEEKQADQWAVPLIARAKELGLTDGTKPKGLATRQEVIAMSLSVAEK